MKIKQNEQKHVKLILGHELNKKINIQNKI